MKDTPVKTNRYVSSESLHKAANQARIDHPYRKTENHTNPYSGELIVDYPSYERYIREHAFYDLCDRQIILNEKKTQQELDSLNSKLIEAQNKASVSEHYRRISKRFLLLFLVSVLSLLIVIVVATHKIKDAFSDGHTSGYSDGHTKGYQDGYDIGYADGEYKSHNEQYSKGDETNSSKAAQGTYTSSQTSNYSSNGPRANPIAETYIGNRKTGIFHVSSCSYLPDSEHQVAFDSYDEAASNGFKPCGHCSPR